MAPADKTRTNNRYEPYDPSESHHKAKAPQEAASNVESNDDDEEPEIVEIEPPPQATRITVRETIIIDGPTGTIVEQAQEIEEIEDDEDEEFEEEDADEENDADGDADEDGDGEAEVEEADNDNDGAFDYDDATILTPGKISDLIEKSMEGYDPTTSPSWEEFIEKAEQDGYLDALDAALDVEND